MKCTRLARSLVGLLAVFGLLLTACDNDDDSNPSPTGTASATAIEVEVAGGKPADGVERHRIDVGDTVTITVIGDTTDELHIHGYDLLVKFSPGQPGSITFEAKIPGIFEVESHHRGDLVMELQVG